MSVWKCRLMRSWHLNLCSFSVRGSQLHVASQEIRKGSVSKELSSPLAFLSAVLRLSFCFHSPSALFFPSPPLSSHLFFTLLSFMLVAMQYCNCACRFSSNTLRHTCTLWKTAWKTAVTVVWERWEAFKCHFVFGGWEYVWWSVHGGVGN